LGLSGEIIESEKIRLSFAVDALHPNDNVEWVNAGLEYAVAETFFLRSGVHYRIGGSGTQIKLDYSYSAFGRLKNVQRLSLGIRF